jgi:hypothetical protein
MISFLKTELIQNITKEQYIQTCINNALSFNGDDIPAIIEGYRSLNALREEFIIFIANELVENKAGEKLIHIEAFRNLDDVFVADCITAISTLKENDPIYKGTFSLLQDIENIIVVDYAVRKRVGLEFKSLFTSIGEKRKTFNGEKKILFGA